MTLANALTLLRLIIAFASFLLMYLEWWFVATLGLVVAVLLDIVDGFVARRYAQVSVGGIYFDVLADKIVIISTYLVLGVLLHGGFFVLGIFMLAREYTIDTMRTVAAIKHIVIPGDRLSKIKGGLFMVAMLLGVISGALDWPGLTVAALVLGSAGMVFAYVTLVRFSLRYLPRLVGE